MLCQKQIHEINIKSPPRFYSQRDDKKGLVFSVILHLSLLAAIIISALNKTDSAAGPLQLELWTEGTEQIVAPPAETRTPDPAEEDTRTEEDQPQPEPEPEPTPAPDPEPVHAAEPPKQAPPPPPPKAAAAASNMSEEDPEIALEKKRAKEKAEKEAKRLAEQEAKEKAEKRS